MKFTKVKNRFPKISPLNEKVGKFRQRKSRNTRLSPRRYQTQWIFDICNHGTQYLRLITGFSKNHSLSRKIIMHFGPQNIGPPHYVAPARRSWDNLIPNCISCLDNRFLLENKLLRSLFELPPNNITSRLGPSIWCLEQQQPKTPNTPGNQTSTSYLF